MALLLVGSVFGVLGQVAYDRLTRPTPATEARRFIPPTVFSGGRVSLGIRGRLPGICTARGSRIDPERPQAHLCSDESGRPFDPCFLNTGKPTLNFGDYLCFTAPWPTTKESGGRPSLWAVGIDTRRLTPSLPPPGGVRFRAWALELEGGTRCLRSLEPAVGEPEDKLYDCADEDDESAGGETVGWVVEFPDDRVLVWRVAFVRASEIASGSIMKRVVRAWY